MEEEHTEIWWWEINFSTPRVTPLSVLQQKKQMSVGFFLVGCGGCFPFRVCQSKGKQIWVLIYINDILGLSSGLPH